MATAQLSAQARSGTGKGVARSLRREGLVPGVIYGPARTPQPLTVSSRDLETLLEHIAAENTVIELSLDGASSPTLIREIQRDPIRRHVIHVDFQELVAGEKVTVYIPLVLQGVPLGVRASSGILNQVMQEVECEVDPTNMPSRIVIDVTELGVGHSVHVSDIVVPEGLEILEDPELTVAVVSAPRAEEEETPAEGEAAEAPTEPELIRKPKEEEEGESEEE
jgi:large subunit ribosomal protein L25